jgi:glycolate oxidase iron-sulfur subunit
MQTSLADAIKSTPQGQEAERILRSCVHCGFCTATCPTYQLLGDELDGPRGRIYLIKQVLEGQSVSASTQLHLDRCLTCRSCESTCPSGVRYARLAEIGRDVVEQQVPRPPVARAVRWLLRQIVPYRKRFGALLQVAHALRPALPGALRNKVPQRQSATPWPTRHLQRKILVLQGCVQAVATPNTNAAAARVLDRLGITLLRAHEEGCCGALSLHLSAHEEALQTMRRNIDAWWPHVEQGIEAILSTASGCGTVVKDYAELLKHDPVYAAKAVRVSALCKDLCELLTPADVQQLHVRGRQRVAFQSPCSLQHGQKITQRVEALLAAAGYTLTPVTDPHLCCGSAGTYSLLQAELSQKLLQNKVAALASGGPDVIASANIGCQLHLQNGTSIPVRHWIELLEPER